MALYKELPEIRAHIKDGVTTVYRDGLAIKAMETHPSQIREERESLLWKVGDDGPQKAPELEEMKDEINRV